MIKKGILHIGQHYFTLNLAISGQQIDSLKLVSILFELTVVKYTGVKKNLLRSFVFMTFSVIL